WTFDKYISFVTMLMLVFGLGFQTPIAVFVLNRTGLVSIESFRKSRKYMIVAIVAIAAIATPSPDVISQIALAIPLYALFELGILLSWRAQRKEALKENSQQSAG
ncbi:MAG: twin-arginine translocase subunit TatC, partial [Planctomycetota bacterium]